MGVFKNIESWSDRHHPAIFDVFRFMLGLFLLLKGYAFLQNRPFLEDMILNLNIKFLTSNLVIFMMNYVIWVHMVGGLLIMLGIFTRLASLLQLPILVSAFFVLDNLRSYLNSDLWLTIFTLAFLVFFVVMGSGPLSLDRYLGKDK